jgi:hypothetical protein
MTATDTLTTSHSGKSSGSSTQSACFDRQCGCRKGRTKSMTQSPYSEPHRSLSETSHEALHANVLQAPQTLSKSVCNDGYCRGSKFRPYLAKDCSDATETSQVLLPTQVLEAVDVWSISVSNEIHIALMPKQIFVPISPCIAAGSLKPIICHSIRMGHNQCKVLQNPSVMKGSLILRR